MSNSRYGISKIMEFDCFQRELNSAICTIYSRGTRKQRASLKGLFLRVCEIAEKIEPEDNNQMDNLNLVGGRYDVSVVPNVPGMWQLREFVGGKMETIISFRAGEFVNGIGAIGFLKMDEKQQLQAMFKNRYETFQQTRAKY